MNNRKRGRCGQQTEASPLFRGEFVPNFRSMSLREA